MLALIEMELGEMAEVCGRGGRSGSVAEGCMFPLRGQIYPAVRWSVPPICSGGPVSFLNLAVEPTRNTVRFSHTRDTTGWPDPTVLTLEDAGKYLFQAFDSQVYLASAAAAFLRRNGRDVGTFARGVAAELFGGNRNQTNDLRDFFFFCRAPTQNTATLGLFLVLWF